MSGVRLQPMKMKQCWNEQSTDFGTAILIKYVKVKVFLL
jgi:hypothetical protein